MGQRWSLLERVPAPDVNDPGHWHHGKFIPWNEHPDAERSTAASAARSHTETSRSS